MNSSHVLLLFCFFYNSAVRPATTLNVDIKIKVAEGEPIENALRRFKREVNKSGHLFELRYKRFHENAQEKVKRKAAQARQRKRFERMQKRRMNQQNRT
jgi:small subunit ribosomal protein S21